MLVEFGRKCPAFDKYIASVDKDSVSCPYCRGNRGVYANGVDCGFSATPTTEPKFKVGDKVYFRCLLYSIRKVYWDGRFEWLYIFARERTPRRQDELFLSLQECEKHEAIKAFTNGLREMKRYCKKYNLPMGPEINKLLLK